MDPALCLDIHKVGRTLSAGGQTYTSGEGSCMEICIHEADPPSGVSETLAPPKDRYLGKPVLTHMASGRLTQGLDQEYCQPWAMSDAFLLGTTP